MVNLNSGQAIKNEILTDTLSNKRTFPMTEAFGATNTPAAITGRCLKEEKRREEKSREEKRKQR